MHEVHTDFSTVVYHATPASNVDSIELNGLDPIYSQGKLEALWFVSKSNLQWAILHTALRHNCLVSDIVVYAVCVERKSLRKTRWPGRWYCFSKCTPENMSPASWFIEGETDNETL